jgi:Cdc6-like AAA superfamily ATPase
MVSLADRYKLIDFFNLGKSSEIESKSYGFKLVKTKNLVISFKDRFNLEIDNRGMCRFLYLDPMREIWKTRGGNGKTASEEISLLENKKQIILYGPPGTGKTYKTKSISIELIEND